MRPIYETRGDLNNEYVLAGWLTTRLNLMPSKLKIAYGVDYALLHGDAVVGFAEARRRMVNSDTYPTIIISLHKWTQGLSYARDLDVPFWFVVGWNDQIGLLDLRVARTARTRIGGGGRGDRDDWQDKEPVVHIDISEFEMSAWPAAVTEPAEAW